VHVEGDFKLFKSLLFQAKARRARHVFMFL
jgi:hypothetical protein